MPILEVRTNVKRDDVPTGFLKRLSEKTSEISLKPEAICVSQLIPDQLMTFAGTEEPCATVTIRCIGNIKDEKHQPVVAGKLTSFIADELKISPERFYVLFHDLAEDDVAYTGIMFPELKKKLGL